MKVKIKEWNAVATWRWDMPEDDVCGICRVQFDGTCPTCKYPGDDCALCMFSITSSIMYSKKLSIECGALTYTLVIGKCGHSFHMVWTTTLPNFTSYRSKKADSSFAHAQHCLLTWIQQESSRGLCPMCRQSKLCSTLLLRSGPYVLCTHD